MPTTATHSITATYAGDPNYNSVSTTVGSTSSGLIATTLLLTASSNTVTAGQSITFNASLTPSSTGPAVPMGSVTFFDGSTLIGTSNLVGTSASFTISTLTATSNHVISAIYSGDGYYSTSTSNSVGLSSNNTSNATTTNLVISATNPVHGSNVVFTAAVTATAGGTVPTGTVTFTNTATGTLGTGTLANGVATFTTNQLPGGTSTFTASYAGSSTSAPSFSPAASVTLNPEQTFLSISVPVTATFGSAFTVTVTVTGSSGVTYPTGVVTVTPQGTGYTGSSQAGVASGGTSSQGSAAVTVQANGAGTISFTASYAGDKNFAASGPVTSSAKVAKVASKVTLTFSPSTPVAGQPTTLIAKVSFASSIAPTGTVQFMSGSTLIGSATLDNTGTASFIATFPVGNQALTAVYSGDTNYAGATSPTANTITGSTASATTLAIAPNPITAGALVTFTSTVGPTVNGVAPTGSVQFLAAGQVLCSATLASGTASCSALVSATAASNISVTASYVGDATFAPSVSPVVTIVVSNAGGGALTATIAPSTAAGGTTVYVTATVTGPAGIVPTGFVSATVTSPTGAASLSTNSVPLPGTGTSNVATVIIPVTVPTTAGTYSVTVSCVNTNVSCLNNNLALISTAATAGTKIATATVVSAAASTTITSGTTLTAVITPASAGTAAATGTVVFFDGATQIGMGTITAGTTPNTFTATASVTLVTANTHSITAAYSGDTLYAASVSAAIPATTGTTAGLAPTIILTANTTTGLAGGPIVLTATVSGMTAKGTVPTGVVTFYAAATTPRVLGTATLGQTASNAAQAVFSTTLIAASSQSVYAVYAGDTNFATATSAFLTIGLTDYSVSFNPATLSLAAGSTGQVVATVAALNGFAGTVSFGCTPPPNAMITCSVSPAVVTGGGSTTISIQTVANKLR